MSEREPRGDSAPMFVVHLGATSMPVMLDSDDVTVATPLSETQQVGFELSHFEADTSYRIRLGNIDEVTASDAVRPDSVVVVGKRFPNTVTWEFLTYFESARGRTLLFVESRAEDQDSWRRRATLQFVVLPSKLGELQFQRMLDELTGLAAGLVLDLVGKSRVSLDFVTTPAAIFAGSSQLELRTLESAWRRVSATLEALQREAVTVLGRRQRLRQCWGGERMSHRGIRTLASMGTDIRQRGSPRPFLSMVEVNEESNVTLEHQRIAAFLDLLEERAHQCAIGAEAQSRLIERDRPFRDMSVDGESLYETVDLPRIRRLQSAAHRAHALRTRMHEARKAAFLRDVPSIPGPMRSPVFQHVPAYRRFRDAAIHFTRATAVILSEGEEEQLKSTSRMYEQWVLLQILAALRESGLRAEGGARLIRVIGRQRFTLDIERGAHVEFRSRDGRIVAVRYEPWILPRDSARARSDTVYRGREGSVPWSPDILIEVLKDDAAIGVPNTVEYGIVVDAKYSRRLQESQWQSARKYLEIKSTRTDRQVVFQSWLVFPGRGDAISFPDSDVEWTPRGPSLVQGDRALGQVSMIPDASRPLGATGDVQPTDRAREFVAGLLAYLGFPERSLASLESSESA